MTSKITAQRLYDIHQKKLDLTWIAGTQSPRQLRGDDSAQSRSAVVGFLNAIHPNQIQVLGRWELKYLKQLGKNSYHDVLAQLFDNEPVAIIVADNEKVDQGIIKLANDTQTPLFYSTINSQKLVKRLQYYFDRELAETSIKHGVFMEVHGVGVLLTGSSGIGKSELALELINRGHRLIVDDAPELYRSAPDTIRGTCPPLLRGFLEVRGLGILNIREMFGDSAIKPSKNLRLIVQLLPLDQEQLLELDRLEGSYDTQTILDVEIQEVIIPVAPGRNLAVLVEAATRQYIQLQSGYNASLDFIRRQEKLLAESSNE